MPLSRSARLHGMGEREENKTRTRRNLADAAVRLFTARGFDEVTMAQVAAAAGVSRRTAFRYFQSKEDLVMDYPAAWLEVFDRSIKADQDRPVGARIRQASHRVADFIESDPDAVKQLFALAFAHPALAARYTASSRQWTQHLAAEIGRDLDPGPKSLARSAMLAAAVMGIIDSVCEIWATSNRPMKPLLDTGLDLLAEPFAAIGRGDF